MATVNPLKLLQRVRIRTHGCLGSHGRGINLAVSGELGRVKSGRKARKRKTAFSESQWSKQSKFVTFVSAERDVK
jgi:hypothetical protein